MTSRSDQPVVSYVPAELIVADQHFVASHQLAQFFKDCEERDRRGREWVAEKRQSIEARRPALEALERIAIAQTRLRMERGRARQQTMGSNRNDLFDLLRIEDY